MKFDVEEKVCPSCKVMFKTKFEIKHYIYKRNLRKGGDGFKFYFCPICGCYHLTSNIPTGDYMLKKRASHYNRLEQKEKNNSILKEYGLI